MRGRFRVPKPWCFKFTLLKAARAPKHWRRSPPWPQLADILCACDLAEVRIQVAPVTWEVRPRLHAVVRPPRQNMNVEVTDRLPGLGPTGKQDVYCSGPQPRAEQRGYFLCCEEQVRDVVAIKFRPGCDVVEWSDHGVASDTWIQREERERRGCPMDDPCWRISGVEFAEYAVVHRQSAQR